MVKFWDWLKNEVAWQMSTQKPWKMTKDDVLQHWRGLPPNVPFSQVKSVPSNHKGPTYAYDGIRVTGSTAFIDAIISRLKDLASFESPRTRLQVVYRQQVDSKSEMPRPNSFVFYCQIKDRNFGQK